MVTRKTENSNGAMSVAEMRLLVQHLLAATFEADEECLKVITAEAEKYFEEVNEKIKARCREMGVPDRFAPGYVHAWYPRGENAAESRRRELRRVGEARITRDEAKYISDIELWTVEVHRQIIAGTLTSPEAKALITSMPSAKAMMPDLQLKDLEEALPVALPEPRYPWDS